ncbi:hypothetical protein TL16_g10990 [Triparma laevis f. inornata]|uniref:Uncharacterized protein n=2 Tax=Triparma laevis TaxID=1534972 RepID=A0A9W7E693_9STRA|nr:hypothetical protein TrLO_g8915 [Triparma laevis f. longispina]GMH87876.1 hypothetical protein TL16_g10990 [Triparma laevis f. inornata]
MKLSGRRGRCLRGKRKIVAWFVAVKEERCGLCVKASEERMVLDERGKRVEAELREAKAKLRETKMEVVALREGRDDDEDGGGEEQGIAGEVVEILAASTTTKPRVRRPSRKRKEEMGIKKEPRDVKKVKTALPTAKPGRVFWTAEGEAALVEGVNDYGLDFGRIKADYDA